MNTATVKQQLKNAPIVRLGELIEECDLRNHDNALKLKNVRGISIEKKFIATKANMDGVSLNPYKIVNPRWFCYVSVTSRNGEKISLALHTESQPAIVSSSYIVFRSKDEEVLLPEYLYLLFNRPEFDRYARFNSWGSARETFDFSEMERVQIPLPSIEVQRELVAIYDGLQKIVADNEALIPQLEETCRAYMVDLKSKYPMENLGDYIEECDRRNNDNALKLEDVRGIGIEKKFIATKTNMDGVSLSPYKVVSPRAFCYVPVTSRNGGKISLAENFESTPCIVSSSYIVFRSKNEQKLLPEYLYLYFCRPEFDCYSRFNSWGSARETFDFSEMKRVKIPVPPIEIQESIAAVAQCLEESKRLVVESRELMRVLCPALVQKAAHSA